MSSGSWNRGNGVAACSPGNPRIYWTRNWSGTDSIVTRTERHPVAKTVIKKVGARKVTYMSYQKTKSGKTRWVKREVWVPIKAVTHVSSSRNVKFRITSAEDAKGIYPASVINLLPTALRKREDDAGLNESSPLVERLTPDRGAVPTPYASTDRNPARKPKRARLQDNPYTMDEFYMRDVSKFYLQDSYKQYYPKICFPATESIGSGMVFCVQDWAPSVLFDANDDIKLINKLREKVIGSDFNAAVALGELGQSMDLISNAAIRLARYMAAMKRGNFVAAHKALFDTNSGRVRKFKPAKSLASNHLSLEYGWKPLLNDVVGGAEALAHALNTPVQKTYRVSRSVRLPQTRLTNVPNYCNIRGFQIEAKGLKEQRKGLIARFREKPTIPKLLGLLDPEVVLWERTPFSFIADWFIPLGDWLTARGFAQGLDATFITSDKRVGRAYEPTGPRYFTKVPSDGEALFSRVYFSRTVSTTLAVRPPVTKPLSKSLSWAHMTNAVALLISNHGGKGYK